jgi:hypothetical protein
VRRGFPAEPAQRVDVRGIDRRAGRREREVTLAVRDGFVTTEFIDLARTEDRTPDQEMRLTALKAEMAGRLMAAPAEAVYAVSRG